MRLFWVVMRFTDDAIAVHPGYAERNVFYIPDSSFKRSEIPMVLFPSYDQACKAAAGIAQKHPTESIIVLEQKCVYELPELPKPVKKKINSAGELVPDA
jgi:hypothetical protein